MRSTPLFLTLPHLRYSIWFKVLKNKESHRVAWRIFMARDCRFCQHFRERRLWLGTRVSRVRYAYKRLFNIRRVYVHFCAYAKDGGGGKKKKKTLVWTGMKRRNHTYMNHVCVRWLQFSLRVSIALMRITSVWKYKTVQEYDKIKKSHEIYLFSLLFKYPRVRFAVIKM